MAEKIGVEEIESRGIESDELEKAIVETELGSRLFDAPGFGLLEIRFPTPREQQIAEMEYSKTFTELLESNLKTSSEMEAILEKRGVWTKADEKRVEELYNTISELNEKLVKSSKSSEKIELAKEIAAVRKMAHELNQRKENYMSNTIEAKADFVRLGHTLALVTKVVDTGERLWKNFDAFNDEKNQEGLTEVTYEWLTFRSGLPSNFLEQLPGVGVVPEENGAPDGR